MRETWVVVNGDGFVNPRRFETCADAERAIERGYGSDDAVAVLEEDEDPTAGFTYVIERDDSWR